MTRPAALVLAVACLAAPAAAQSGVHGHLKYQYAFQHFAPADLGARLVGSRVSDHLIDVRIGSTRRWQRFDATADAELIGLGGDTIGAAMSRPAGPLTAPLLGLPDLSDRHQALDLGWSIAEGARAALVGRLDRLSVGYTGNRLVARLGRQALSWGNGLVFQVLDLFNPFPPNVLDTDYKPGRDMLTTQWLFAGGDDVQAIVVPGRSSRDRPLSGAESSAAAKWHHFAGAAELDLLVARHHDSTVIGGGGSHGAAGGVWRVDLSYTNVGGRHVTSVVANFDRAWVPGGRTVYAFGEYFYNGFGVATAGRGPVVADEALETRIERGELFNLGRHEAASGLRIEWTPLVTVSPTALVNLTDASTFVLLQVEYDWRQNLVVHAGLQAGLGRDGTEYGGTSVVGLPGEVAPGTRLWARLARYF